MVREAQSSLSIFIAYRQGEGDECAQWLYEHLAGRPIELQDGMKVALKPYWDKQAPAISDWRKVWQGDLRTARALIIVCTPQAKKRRPKSDWLHDEIDWWVKYRKVAPILIQASGCAEEIVPDSILKKWPFAQRLDWSDRDGRARILDRIVRGLILSERGIHYQELSRLKWRNRVLATLLFLAVIFGGFALYQSDVAKRQRHIADSRALAAESTAVLAIKPELALLLAAAAYETAPSERAAGALLAALTTTDHIRAFFYPNEQAPVADLAFSADASSFAILHDTDGIALSVFDTGSLKRIYQSESERPLGDGLRLAGGSKYESIAFWPSTSLLAVAAKNGIYFIDLKDPKEPMKMGNFATQSISFDESGLFAAFSAGEYLCILDSPNRQSLCRATGRPITNTKISSSGRLVVTSSETEVTVWDTRTILQLPARKEGEKELLHMAVLAEASQSEQIKALAISNDEGRLVTVGSASLYLWALDPLEKRMRLDARQGDLMSDVAFHPSKPVILTAGGGGSTGSEAISLWKQRQFDTDFRAYYERSLLVGFEHTTMALEFSRDGRYLLSGDRAGQIILWDFETHNLRTIVLKADSREVTSFAVSPNSHEVALGFGDGSFQLVDYLSGKRVQPERPASASPVVTISYSSDGRNLYIGSKLGEIEMWDLEAWKMIRSYKLGLTESDLVTLIPDPTDRYLAVIRSPGLVDLHNAITLAPRKLQISCDGHCTRTLGFSPDGEHLVIATGNTISVWRSADGSRIGGPMLGGTYVDFKFRFDGRRLAIQYSGEYEIELLDEARIQTLLNANQSLSPSGIALSGHQEPVTAMSFSSSGRFLASASADRVRYDDTAIYFWNGTTGVQIGRPVYLEHRVIRLLFSHDEKYLLAEHPDGSVSVLDIDPNSWMVKARAVANRGFSASERQRYAIR